MIHTYIIICVYCIYIYIFIVGRHDQRFAVSMLEMFDWTRDDRVTAEVFRGLFRASQPLDCGDITRKN